MAKIDLTHQLDSTPETLDGQLLIAMPGMRDPRFERSVIFMCAHSEDGAMGIIINHHSRGISFSDLFEQLEIFGDDEPPLMSAEIAQMPIHEGGPVETSRGFVLHSDDYYVADATLPIEGGVCLTATIDILRAIASGEGPAQRFLALGYAGWSPGQLENEIRQNGWLHCPVDPELLFNTPLEMKYDRALALLGIDPAFLNAEAGHA